MWIIGLLLLLSPQVVSDSNPWGRASAPKPAMAPFLVVKVVDPTWLPIPNAVVTIKPVNEKREPKVAHAEANGDAEFWMQEDADYTIEAKYLGFKTKRLKSVFVGNHVPTFPTFYIEVELQPAQPTTTVY